MTRKIILLGVIALSLLGLVYLTFGGAAGEPPVPALPDANTPTDATTGPAAAAAPAKPGETPDAPDFTLPALSGGTIKLSSLRGKVVVLNFWSITCPPCIAELPTFEKLNDIMKGKPFQILTVAGESREQLELAARQLGIKVPVLLDDGRVADAYGVYYTPVTFIIDMDGKVNQRFLGAANWADRTVVEYINRLIAQGQQKK